MYSPCPAPERNSRAYSSWTRASSIGHHHRLADDSGHLVAMFVERVIHHRERRDLPLAQGEGFRIPVAESRFVHAAAAAAGRGVAQVLERAHELLHLRADAPLRVHLKERNE